MTVRDVVIRVDSSYRIGSGHMSRCHTLARRLRESGAVVRFVCRDHPGSIVGGIRDDGFDVITLPAPPVRDLGARDHKSWLGVSEEQDARDMAAIGGTTAQWVIVDHYSLGVAWERAVRTSGTRILAIDDLADRPHDCDVLLDQNWFGEQSEARYDGLVPNQARLLIGPQFALLRPEFARLRPQSRSGDLRRALIYFGADLVDMTGTSVDALSGPRFAGIELNIVVSANFPFREQLEARAAARGKARVHGPRPHLADLMACSDLAIGAGGATTWERMCMGLSSAVVTMADNQRPVCEHLAREGFIELVGHFDSVTSHDLSVAVERVLARSDRQEHETLLMSMCDGGGTDRVARELVAS